MSLQADLAAQQQTVIDQQIERDEAQALYRFFTKYPELNLFANVNMMREYIEPLPLTFENMESALGNGLKDRLAVKSGIKMQQDESREREALIGEIHGSNPRGISPENLAREKRIYSAMPIEQLRRIAGDKREERRIRALPIEDLKRGLRQKPAEEAVVIPYTRQELLKMSANQLRAVYTLGGQADPRRLAAVNKILSGQN